MKKFTYEEVNYLKKKGFEVDFMTDLSGWWMKKFIKSKYFGKCEIMIDEFRDVVWINVGRNSLDEFENSLGYGVDFIKTPYSRKNLKKIIKMLRMK